MVIGKERVKKTKIWGRGKNKKERGDGRGRQGRDMNGVEREKIDVVFTSNIIIIVIISSGNTYFILSIKFIVAK